MCWIVAFWYGIITAFPFFIIFIIFFKASIPVTSLEHNACFDTRGRSHKVPRSIFGYHFFIFALFGLIFGYCGANGCYFDMLKFQGSTPGDNRPGNNCHRRQLTISQPLQAIFKWDKAKLVYSNSTIQLATNLPLIGGTSTQGTTAQARTATEPIQRPY